MQQESRRRRKCVFLSGELIVLVTVIKGTRPACTDRLGDAWDPLPESHRVNQGVYRTELMPDFDLHGLKATATGSPY